MCIRDRLKPTQLKTMFLFLFCTMHSQDYGGGGQFILKMGSKGEDAKGKCKWGVAIGNPILNQIN